MGVQGLGMGLGTLIRQMGVRPEIVIGRDFRQLFGVDQICSHHRPAGAGCKVHDHRLAGDADGSASSTSIALRRHGDGSHNENGGPA